MFLFLGDNTEVFRGRFEIIQEINVCINKYKYKEIMTSLVGYSHLK